ncbi:MAG: HmuY family protein [Spirochaetota bacterium]
MKFGKQIIQLSCFLILIACETQKSDSSGDALLILLNESQLTSNQSVSTGSCTSASESGLTATTVNATNYDLWTYCNLKESAATTESTGDWDLRFQRFKIGTKSGTSDSSGSGASCDTGSTDWNATFTTTSCTLAVDENQSQQGGGGGGNEAVSWDGSSALKEWYNYSNTILTAKDNIYLIRGSSGQRYFLIQMRDYYDTAGSSGHPKFRWKEL